MSLQEILGSEIYEDNYDENSAKGEKDFEYQNVHFGEEDDDDEKDYYKTNNILKAKISHYTNGLQVESVIKSLETGYYVIPKFQRRFVWKKEQVANLALSIIKDVPIPPLYLYWDKKKQVILDGQQRVTAIFLYFKNLWYSGKKEYHPFAFKEIECLNSRVLDLEEQLEKAKENGLGKSNISELKKQIKGIYSELKEKHGVVRSQFYIEDNGEKREITFSSFEKEEQEFLFRKRIDITVVECGNSAPQRVFANIFKLLNSGGKLLGSQEIRNGIYWELPLYDDLFRLNKNLSWRMIYRIESPFAKDIEILLKMLALNYFTVLLYETNGGREGTDETIEVRFDGTFNWSNIMEEYSSISAAWIEREEKEEIERLETFLNNIQGIQDIEKKCNKAVFEAVFVAACKLNYTSEIDYDWLCSLEQEEEFGKGNVLSNKKSVETRLTKALKKLKEKINA